MFFNCVVRKYDYNVISSNGALISFLKDPNCKVIVYEWTSTQNGSLNISTVNDTLRNTYLKCTAKSCYHKVKPMKPILLFDIDGTLLNVDHSFIKTLIDTMLDEMGLLTLPVKSRTFAGRTDRDIFYDLVSSSDNAEELYQEVKERYLSYMKNHFSNENVSVIEGVEELVDFVVKENYPIGLCTGNYRESAFIKVESAGFKDIFTFGGFGCNHADRAYLPGEAHEEYVMLSGKIPNPDQYIIIGDTPNDIRCAKHFGAKVVSVSTGSYGETELKQYQPDLHLRNLNELIDYLTIWEKMQNVTGRLF